MVAFATQRGISQRRAATLAGIGLSSARYQSKATAGAAQAELLARLGQIKDAHPRFGVPRALALLRAQGQIVNHKRVERLWKAARFQVPCLDREAFVTLKETQACLEGHRRFYNEERPHSSLGYLAPAAFRRGWETQEIK